MEAPLYDVIGIGFGPSNIALAVAMRDMGYEGKVRFFEQAPRRKWQHGMLLGGSDIQHNPLRDFSTPVNPRGHFTFTNYLHCTAKFFQYLNLGLTYAYRAEFAAYVEWVKAHFEEVVEPDGVAGLEAVPGEPSLWRVTTADGTSHVTRSVVIGTGRARRWPKIPGLEESRAIIHLTNYLDRIDDIDRGEPVVVVGASQSSAEIVLDLLRRGYEDVHLIQRTFSFQLKDTSPFSDEIYFPEFVDYFHDLPEAARKALSSELRRTNYSSVDGDVLEEIYRLRHQLALAGRKPLTIHRNHEIERVEMAHPHHRLTIRERYKRDVLSIDAALTILGTGFLDIGRDGREAVPPVLRKISDDFLWSGEDLQITRRYAVQFAEPGAYPPLYLNGLCEMTHGFGDAGSFSLVSIRARDILTDIRGT